ncbi:MAG: DNA-directed DNA polymerase II small subunit [Candidatus Odinarchaeota archaeon]|nr:DNA-directed DNA polymerase II small subunit [Candidatus Odinarchaeota archaeon]
MIHTEAKDVAKEIVDLFIKSGFQLTKDGLEYILSLEKPYVKVKEILDSLSRAKVFLVNSKVIEDVIRSKSVIHSPHPKMQRKMIVRNLSIDVRVIKDVPREFSMGEDILQTYRRYFLDRYEKLRRILEEHSEGQSITDIAEVKGMRERDNLSICGMVTSKGITKNKNIIMELEDPTGSIKVVMNGNVHPKDTVNFILPDHVVLAVGKVVSSGLFIAKDVQLPDVPTKRKPNRAPEDVYAVFISDTHIGSKKFLPKVFQRFLDWINGRLGTGLLKEVASKVGYLVVAGDVVDGIGVYPGQQDDLEIMDIEEQYEKTGEFFGEIPDDVQVIVSPGNHDATGQALPQRRISERYAKKLHENDFLTCVGNPSMVSLSGVKVLIYHGRGLEDVLASIPNGSYTKPMDGVKVLLKGRHLCPIWGGKTPIAPSEKDELVIEDVPDILHTGHLHKSGVSSYRGVLLIQSGTFQEQTDYQRMMGFDPDPGKVFVVNLKTLKPFLIDFTQIGY